MGSTVTLKLRTSKFCSLRFARAPRAPHSSSIQPGLRAGFGYAVQAHSLLPLRRSLAAASCRYVESVTSQRYDGALMTGPAVCEARRIQLCAGAEMWLNKPDDFHGAGREIKMPAHRVFFGHRATLARPHESYRQRGVRKCNWE